MCVEKTCSVPNDVVGKILRRTVVGGIGATGTTLLVWCFVAFGYRGTNSILWPPHAGAPLGVFVGFVGATLLGVCLLLLCVRMGNQ